MATPAPEPAREEGWEHEAGEAVQPQRQALEVRFLWERNP